MSAIIDGKYRDNEMLPPERHLSQELGVSRTVVREALQSLETQGVLRVVHGKGVQVVPVSSETISDSFSLYLSRTGRSVSQKDLMMVRLGIEPEIARHAALNATNDELTVTRALLEKSGTSISNEEMYVPLHLEFHLQLAQMTQNILFLTIYEALLMPLRRRFMDRFDAEDNKKSFFRHMEVFESIERRDAERAYELTRLHFEIAE